MILLLGYKESSYGECLKVVRENPELLAECLVRGERNNPEKMQEALRTVFGSLYGYGLIPEDQEYSLKLLKSLIEIQLDANSNPRRLLQKVSTFSYAYKVFVENLHETKLYLAAALHQPILQALAEDDVYLDIDPKHLTNRFTAEEKKRRFGEEGTERYNQNFKEYRSKVVLKLVSLLLLELLLSNRGVWYSRYGYLLWLSVHVMHVSIIDERVKPVPIHCAPGLHLLLGH